MQPSYRLPESLWSSPVSRLTAIAAVMLASAFLVGACSQSATAPTAPTALNRAPEPTTTKSVTDAQLTSQAANLTPEDFAARGWQCRPSLQVQGRIVCSHPGQGFPAIPPPDDRPPTFTYLAWQDGTFAGTILLIRPDLYHGQICESTGEPYEFRSRIGYYECLHTTGG